MSEYVFKAEFYCTNCGYYETRKFKYGEKVYGKDEGEPRSNPCPNCGIRHCFSATGQRWPIKKGKKVK